MTQGQTQGHPTEYLLGCGDAWGTMRRCGGGLSLIQYVWGKVEGRGRRVIRFFSGAILVDELPREPDGPYPVDTIMWFSEVVYTRSNHSKHRI